MALNISQLAVLVFCFNIINAFPEIYLTKSNSYGHLDSREISEEYSKENTSEDKDVSYLPKRRSHDKDWSDEYYEKEEPCSCQIRTYRQVAQPSYGKSQYQHNKDIGYLKNKQVTRNGFNYGEDKSKISEIYYPEEEEYIQETVVAGNDVMFKTEDIKRGRTHGIDLSNDREAGKYFEAKNVYPEDGKVVIKDGVLYRYHGNGKMEVINGSPSRNHQEATQDKKVYVANDKYSPVGSEKGTYKVENVIKMPSEVIENEKMQIIKGKNGKYVFEELKVKPNEKPNDKKVEYVYQDNGEQYEYVVNNNNKEQTHKYSIPSNIETIKRYRSNQQRSGNGKEVVQEQLYLLPNIQRDQFETSHDNVEPGILVLKPNEELVIMEYPEYGPASYPHRKDDEQVTVMTQQIEKYEPYYENYYPQPANQFP